MTVTANSRRREYQGNGVTTVFNGPMAFQRSHVQAYLRTGTAMVALPSSAYDVERLGQEAGTRVILQTPPAVNTTLILLRTMPYTQDVDVTNQGAFHAETIEKGFDALAMQIQQLDDGSLQMVVDPATGQFAWDARGNRIINVGAGILPGDAVNLGQVLLLVESGGGGGTGVAPLSWSGVAEDDDENIVFELDGAEVDDPRFYDVAAERVPGEGKVVLAPYEDFTIDPPSQPGDPFTLVLAEGLAPDCEWSVVLRGYARPYVGPSPLTTVAPTIINDIDGDTLIDGSYRNTIIVITSATDVLLTIRLNTGAENDWKRGDYFSAMQMGTGKVRFAIEDDGNLIPSPGFSSETRGQGSVISATSLDVDALEWAVSGDLFRVVDATDTQCFAIPDRAALYTTNIATGTLRGSFVMPYDFMLNDVLDGGLYASLTVAQATGALVTVDVNRNGTSILSTRLTFDNAEKTTLTAATPPVFAAGGRQLGKGDEITIDIDQVGTALAKGLTVYLVGNRVNA